MLEHQRLRQGREGADKLSGASCSVLGGMVLVDAGEVGDTASPIESFELNPTVTLL
jgi:hypothetical protein